MTQQVDAVYEQGRLRPLGQLTLAESQRVHLTISATDAEMSRRDQEFLDWAKAEVAAMSHVPSLEEVRAALSKIPGSLVDDFAAEREK